MSTPILPTRRSAPSLRIGQVIDDRFRLEHDATPTDAGAAFEAVEIATGRRVTVELATALPDAQARTRFLRDAARAQRLDGEHVLSILDVGTLADGLPWLVREHAVSTLAAEVRARGPIATAQAVAWTLEACEAIAEGHALGMAHGDVRAETVFLARSAGPQPIAKVAWTSAAKAEHLAREDVATDIAGLGRLLRTLVVGREIAPDADDAPTLPTEIAHVVARALAKDPDGHYANVGELARALAPFAPPGHTSARNATFILSRAGMLGATAPAATAPAATAPAASAPAPAAAPAMRARSTAASASPPESLREGRDPTTEWFRRPSQPVVVGAPPRRRGGAFAFVALAVVGAVAIGTFALWRAGALPRWTGAAPPEAVGVTQLTSGDLVTTAGADQATDDGLADFVPPIDEHHAPQLAARAEPERGAGGGDVDDVTEPLPKANATEPSTSPASPPEAPTTTTPEATPPAGPDDTTNESSPSDGTSY